jgi:heavy metal translocating P-type ATPase
VKGESVRRASRSSGRSFVRNEGNNCCSVTSSEACKESKPMQLGTSCIKSCCAETKKPVTVKPNIDKCCSSGSCSKEKEELPSSTTSNTNLDLENGNSNNEHVILNVQGMTCTGCETQLERTLANIPGISNIKTSLLLCRAEFDVSTGQISIDDAVVRLQRATDFSCQVVSQNASGHELEVLALGFENILLKPLPFGVISINSTSDSTIKITYNPQVTGARDIITSAFDQELRLAPIRPDATISAGNKHVRQTGIITLLSIFLTLPVLILAWAPLPKHEILYGSISLALATLVQFFIAGPFYPAAIKSLVYARAIEMDLLIVLSTSTAYIFSIVAFAMAIANKPLSTGEFFETSTLLVTLIVLGRFITALARQKAVESISIRSLQQHSAVLIEENGTTRNIDVRLLQYKDKFRVMPETKIVTDGTVISGNSEVDESMITGESNPVVKHKGSPVIAGSVNGSGFLDIQITRLCDDNTISTIANMVDEAKYSKPKTQELADRVAGYFVPIVGALSLLSFAIWVAIGITLQNRSSSDATVQAVTYAITVLIISCPCAIGLAVPMVIVMAGGVAADNGVIFKSAESIEAAKNVTHVVFDKTGTLTTGNLSVRKSTPVSGLEEDAKSILLGLVSKIKHPVSRAITLHLQDLGVHPANVSDIKSLPGKGVLGKWKGNEIRAGNPVWTHSTSSQEVEEILTTCYTLFCLTVNHTLYSIYALEDTLRPEAVHVVSNLHARGINVSIVSGDSLRSVEKTAISLDVPLHRALSLCSPMDKKAYIQSLRISSPKSTILFLGDGTNDAIALAEADIGIHMGSGTDVARSAADVVLTRADLGGVILLMKLSGMAMRRIVFNFAWSFIYNILAILLAAGAFVRWRIPPAFAGVGEIVSVLPVIGVALSLRWAKLCS